MSICALFASCCDTNILCFETATLQKCQFFVQPNFENQLQQGTLRQKIVFLISLCVKYKTWLILVQYHSISANKISSNSDMKILMIFDTVGNICLLAHVLDRQQWWEHQDSAQIQVSRWALRNHTTALPTQISKSHRAHRNNNRE